MDEKKRTKIIKYAIEQTITIPLHYTEQDKEDCIKTLARGKDYIWCEEDEDLFSLENK